MSLIYWYPLTNDTLDYSGNNNHATNNGAVIDNAGKIGKCYSFDGIDDYMSILEIEMVENTSIALWYYWTGSGNEMLFGKDDIDNYFSCDGNRYHLKDHSNNNLYWDSSAPKVNKWAHIVLTRSNGIWKLFVDGVNIGSTNVLGTFYINEICDGYTGDVYKFTGKLNDFRIYNHALSDKEIKELSKAKILHYTFDDFQEPTVNLHSEPELNRYTKDQIVTSQSWGVTGTITAVDFKCPESSINGLSLKINVATSGSGGLYCSIPELTGNKYTLVEGKTYTRSFWVYSNDIRNISGHICSSNRPSDNLYIVGDNIDVGPYWKKFSHTFTVGVGQGGVFHTRHILYDTIRTVYVTCIQIEEKTYYTPFINGTRDGLVSDISGYQNNSTLNLSTTPQWISDSRIGKGAYKFDGTKYIKKSTSTSSYIPAGCDYTQSLWFNAISIPIRSVLIDDNNQWEHWIAINTNLTVYGSYYNLSQYSVTSTNTIELNRWYYVVLSVISGSSIKLYVNGELWAENNSISGVHSKIYDDLLIGSNGGANAEKFNGLIDDVRLYATALSSDDIKELYQTRMQLDNTGNLYISDINEDIAGINISEKGILSCNEISEVGITDGLIAYYPLDENANDYSVNNNHGTVTGCTIINGIKNRGYSFSGNGIDKISILYNPVLNIREAITLSIWIKRLTVYNQLNDVMLISRPPSWFFYDSYNSGNIRGDVYIDGIRKAGIDVSVPFDGNWYNIVYTYDGINGKSQMFKNGILTNYVQLTGLSNYLIDSSTANLSSIGLNSSSRGLSIDEARIYNRILSAEEIKIMYDLGIGNAAMKVTSAGNIYINNEVKEV